MMKKVKLSGIGLDTSNLNYLPVAIDEDETNYNYIYTNISANNGLVVRPLINRQSRFTLVTGVDFLDHVSLAIREHLYELSVQKVDILLIDSKCNWEEYKEEIDLLLESGLVDEIGIKNPELLDIGVLDDLRKKFNLRYFGINLCPLYYSKEVLDLAENTGTYVFGFNPFGGKISAPSLIDSFTVPYLLNFSAMHSDVVFLSGRDIVFSNVNKDYLKPVIDSSLEESIYTVKKSVDKLIKPLKRVGHISLKVDEELFPISETDSVFNLDEITINLGEAAEKFDTILEISEDDKVGQDILRYLEDAYLPKDTNRSSDYMSIVRPKAFSLFRANYPESKGWFNVNVFLGDVYLFSASRETRSKRWFSPDIVEVETHIYILYHSNKTGFVLRNVQNSIANH